MPRVRGAAGPDLDDAYRRCSLCQVGLVTPLLPSCCRSRPPAAIVDREHRIAGQARLDSLLELRSAWARRIGRSVPASRRRRRPSSIPSS